MKCLTLTVIKPKLSRKIPYPLLISEKKALDCIFIQQYSLYLQPEGKKKPNIEFSGNLAVVKTRPGYAMGIASDIDSHAPSEILATIAGDDTILVIPRNGVSQEKVIAALSHFI